MIADERSCPREVVDVELTATLDGLPTRLFVYDLSPHGCMIESKGEAGFRTGQAIVLDLPQTGPVAGCLVWTNGKTGGVQFAAPLAETVVNQLGSRMPAAILPRRSAPVSADPEASALPPREQERATITVRCETRIGLGIWNFAILLDLSTHGFQLVRAPGCVIGAKVRLRIPGMEMLTATVRWMSAENVGCAFDRPLSPYVFEHLVAKANASRIGSF